MTYHPQKGRGYGQFCRLPWCSDNFHHVWSWYNYPFTSYSVFLLTCYVTLWLRPFDLGQWSYMVSQVVNRSINVRETLAKQLEPGQRRKCNLIVLLPCWTCVSATQYTSDGTNYDSFKQQYTNSKLPVRWWIRAGSSTVEASASQSPFPSSWQQSQPLYRLGGSRGGPDGERHLWWRCWQVTQMETQEHHRLTTGRGLHCCNTHKLQLDRYFPGGNGSAHQWPSQLMLTRLSVWPDVLFMPAKRFNHWTELILSSSMETDWLTELVLHPTWQE